jgi:hypothetical protein
MEEMEAAGVLELRTLREELRGEVAKLEEALGGEAGQGGSSRVPGDGEEEEEEGGDGEEGRGDDDDDSIDAEEMGMELEATRRMLRLVEATEQQLAAQGQSHVHESGPTHLPVEAGTEVRAQGGDGKIT